MVGDFIECIFFEIAIWDLRSRAIPLLRLKRESMETNLRHGYQASLLVFAKFRTFQIILGLPAFRSAVYKVRVKTFIVLYLTLRNVITCYIMPY